VRSNAYPSGYTVILYCFEWDVKLYYTIPVMHLCVCMCACVRGVVFDEQDTD